MVGRRVVRDEVDDHPDPVVGRLGDERLGLGRAAELGVDLAIVGDVVAAVAQRRAIPRVDPHGVDPEVAQIAQTRPHPGDVAGAVAVAVGERPDVDLVDDGVAPPVAGGLPGVRTQRIQSQRVQSQRMQSQRIQTWSTPSRDDRNATGSW
jgi:hypothetical protein